MVKRQTVANIVHIVNISYSLARQDCCKYMHLHYLYRYYKNPFFSSCYCITVLFILVRTNRQNSRNLPYANICDSAGRRLWRPHVARVYSQYTSIFCLRCFTHSTVHNNYGYVIGMNLNG